MLRTIESQIDDFTLEGRSDIYKEIYISKSGGLYGAWYDCLDGSKRKM